MTQAASSPASSRAERCSVIDSLKFSFSSRSLVTAVTRSIRCVMASTAPAERLPLASAAPLPEMPASVGRTVVRSSSAPAVPATSATATINRSRSPLTLTRLIVSSRTVAPVELSRPQRTRPTRPLRATAWSCVCTAARLCRATKVVNDLPVA